MTTADPLFAPADLDWRGLAKPYRTLRRIGTLFWVVPFAMAAAVAYLFMPDMTWLWIALLAAGLLLAAYRFWRMDALWRSYGYAELADDLYITRGIMFRRLTAVPYGRMQLVEVESGPVERALGLATVKLVTASASTDATIPGLRPDEAARLRDRLTELGEERASGL